MSSGSSAGIASGRDGLPAPLTSGRSLATYTRPHPCRAATAAERAALRWTAAPSGSNTAVLAALLTRWRADPVAFAFDALHFSLMPYQAQILCDLADSPREVYAFYGLDPNFPKRKVLVPSGHGLGKTKVCSIAIWWHMLCHKFSKRLCTAPTSDQLTGQFMGEIRAAYRALARYWPELAEDWDVQATSVQHKNPLYRDWLTMLRTARADKPESLQGGHALDAIDPFGDLAAIWGEAEERTPAGGFLIVIEEASGVDDVIRKTLEGSLSESGARLLAPGNPTRADGWFAADIKSTDTYAVHHLDCRLSDFETTYTLPYLPPRQDARVHPVRTHGFVQASYWRSILEDCDGDENADFFRVRVRGLPPVSNVTQAMRTEWVDEAMQRSADSDSVSEPIIVSGDFGQTQDKHAACVLQGFNLMEMSEWLVPGRPETQLESAKLALLELQERWGATVLIGDSNGVGAGIMSDLSVHFRSAERRGPPVRVIHFQAGKASNDPTRYARMRCEMWLKWGRKWLSDRRAHLCQHPGLKRQLTAPGFSEDTRNVLRLEPKEAIKKRTGEDSGNAADALMMAIYARGFRPDQAEAQAPDPKPDLHPSFARHFKRLRASARGGDLIGGRDGL